MMAACVKCGHNPDRDSCPYCGYGTRIAHVNDKGVAVYTCCGKPLHEAAKPVTPRGGK